MRCVQHRSNNRVIGAPAGWDQDELPCNAVPVTDDYMVGLPCVTTYWRPTPDELERLKNGGLVRLWVAGRAMIPVAMSVESE